jgi:hypothetical protein
MKFLAQAHSNSYFDDAKEFNVSYISEDIIDFSNYVQALVEHVKNTLRFNQDYKDIHEINVRIFIGMNLSAVEHFRRNEDDTIRQWRTLHN